MKLNSFPVVVYSINPKTRETTVIEVTNLLAIPATFYDYQESEFSDKQSDEITPVHGFITLIGGRSYRLHSVPEERINQLDSSVKAVLEVLVPWDQIEWKGDKAP